MCVACVQQHAFVCVFVLYIKYEMYQVIFEINGLLKNNNKNENARFA